MTTEEQVYEEQRLHDQFTLLLKDVETYLSPVTAELDAFLRLSAATTVDKLGGTRNGISGGYPPQPNVGAGDDNCEFEVVLQEDLKIHTKTCTFSSSLDRWWAQTIGWNQPSTLLVLESEKFQVHVCHLCYCRDDVQTGHSRRRALLSVPSISS